jgi:diguanylate cyclase (GGDEF)-like protein
MRALWAGIPVTFALAAATIAAGLPALVAGAVLLAGYGALAVMASRTVSKLRKQAAESQRAALHDPVTELPNRTLLQDRVQQAIVMARRRGARVAVVTLGLDRFKEINDALGHHCGDLLLYLVGERLAATLRESDSVGRLGGDEFGVLLPEISGATGATDAVERLRSCLTERFEVHGVGLEVEATAGVAIFPDHGDDADLLLQRAEVAMYVAKQQHSGVEIYSEACNVNSRDRLELISELRHAIDDDELVVHFQPIADLSHSTIVGTEALVRWDHPSRGFMPPDAFIPLAETTGLIRPLALYVLEQSLRQRRDWAAGGLDLRVAVNLSTRNLLDPALAAAIEELLRRFATPAKALTVEVTETAVMVDPPRAAETLGRIADLGVRVAIDDFGTGYTSLSWLKRLPVTTLKVDRSFVMEMHKNDNDAAIVRSTVNLARDLGLEVVAEGVETAAAWRGLEALHCDLAQGYLLSRPLPAGELTPWLHDRAATANGNGSGAVPGPVLVSD